MKEQYNQKLIDEQKNGILSLLNRENLNVNPYSKEEFIKLLKYFKIKQDILIKYSHYASETIRNICAPSAADKRPSSELCHLLKELIEIVQIKELFLAFEINLDDSVNTWNEFKNTNINFTDMSRNEFLKYCKNIREANENFKFITLLKKQMIYLDWKSYVNLGNVDEISINNFIILIYPDLVNSISIEQWSILEWIIKQDNKILKEIDLRINNLEQKRIGNIFENIVRYKGVLEIIEYLNNFYKEDSLSKFHNNIKNKQMISDNIYNYSYEQLEFIKTKREIIKNCNAKNWLIFFKILVLCNMVKVPRKISRILEDYGYKIN